MTIPAKANKTDTRYIFVTAVAVVITWVLHEFAHWLAGVFLGYDMVMTFNSTFPVNNRYTTDLHYQLISAAGPALTLAEAIIIFMVMMQRKVKLLYPFLLTCLYMRFLATVMSIRNPNDESRISKSIGLGTFTLPIIMIAIFFILVYKVSRQYRFDTKFNAITVVLIIVFSSLIILADQFFHIRLL
jgi:hypothetical protein